VTVLPKAALRTGGTVWILGDRSTLEIREVTLLAQDPLNAVIGGGLKKGEHVILSHIASPLKGMPLQRAASSGQNTENGVGGGGRVQ
jgi:hypothetical protein